MLKNTKRLREQNRTNLADVIPLKTPFHIFVDPSGACNFKCIYCFHSTGEASAKIMSYELFCKIIDDIKQFPDKLKVLRLYKEGEPLLNKNLSKMIAYARDSNIAENIDFTTNAVYLTRNLSDAMILAGLTAINISVPSLDEEEIFRITGQRVNFDEYLNNIRYLFENKGNCRVHIKTTDVGLEKFSKELFYNIFSKYCDEISVENIVPIWPGKDISSLKNSFEQGIYNQPIEEIDVCPYIFYSMSVNADGTVSSCFIDWEHMNIVGDANTESIKNIWGGEAMKQLRIMHLKKCRMENKLCSECTQLKYATADNIDAYADNLLDIISEK